MPRLAKVMMSHELFQEIMTEGWDAHWRCLEGLPEGAELVNTFFEGGRVGGTIHFVYHHESFEDVPVGDFMPEVMVVFKRIYCEDERSDAETDE